jgi:glycerol-3-phosphate cytidylyltransferase
VEGSMKKKIVITYGTFDVLHYGHMKLLKRAKELGDYLIVGLSTDEFNSVKGKKSYYTFDHRKELLESIKYVDKVIPEKGWEQKVNDLIKNDVDIFVMGNDWEGKFDFLSEYCRVIYLTRTEGISSTLVRKELFTQKM